MEKFLLFLKNIGSTIAIILILVAFCTAVVSVKWYVEQPSADAYEDMGVDVFYPMKAYSQKVQNSTRVRHRSMTTTETVYEVYYQSASGYKWYVETRSKEEGQKIVREAEPVERRVLRLRGDNKFFTIPAEDTVDSYVQKNRRSYLRGLALSGLYLAIGGGIILWKRKNT